jgi:hypothetical protein
MDMPDEETFEVREVFFEDEGGALECPFVFIAYRVADAPAENDGSARPLARTASR